MSCSSLFAQPTLVKQIKFPRHILPLAVVATNVVTLVAMLVVVVVVEPDLHPGDEDDVLGGDPAASCR